MGKYCVKATLASTLAFADENPENLVGDAIVVRRNLIAQGEKEYGNKNRSLLSVKHASLKEVEPVGPLRRLATCCGGTPAKPTVIKTAKPTVAPKKDCELLPGDAYNGYDVELRARRDSLENMKGEYPQLSELWDVACKKEKIVMEDLKEENISFDGNTYSGKDLNSVHQRNKAFSDLLNEINELVAQKNRKISEGNRANLTKALQKANEFKEMLSASDIKPLEQMFKEMDKVSLDSDNPEDFDKVENVVKYINDKFATITNAGHLIETLKNNINTYDEVIKTRSGDLDVQKSYRKKRAVAEKVINFLTDADNDCNAKKMVEKKDLRRWNNSWKIQILMLNAG